MTRRRLCNVRSVPTCLARTVPAQRGSGQRPTPLLAPHWLSHRSTPEHRVQHPLRVPSSPQSVRTLFSARRCCGKWHPTCCTMRACDTNGRGRATGLAVLCALVAAVASCNGATVHVLGPARLRAEFRAAPCEFFGPRNASTRAHVVVSNPINACAPLRASCAGGVLLAEPLAGCSFEAKARHAQRAGCSAMLVHDDTFAVRAAGAAARAHSGWRAADHGCRPCWLAGAWRIDFGAVSV